MVRLKQTHSNVIYSLLVVLNNTGSSVVIEAIRAISIFFTRHFCSTKNTKQVKTS